SSMLMQIHSEGEPIVHSGDYATGALGLVGAEIARNALVATCALFVHVSAFDPATGLLHTAASAGLRLATVQAAMAAIQRLIPGWSLDRLVLRADANPANRAVYYQGRTVSAPLRDVAEGIVDRRIVHLGTEVFGVRHSLVCPLLVRDRVAGALSFHTRDPVDDPQRRTCEAFARQAALTIEN